MTKKTTKRRYEHLLDAFDRDRDPGNPPDNDVQFFLKMFGRSHDGTDPYEELPTTLLDELAEENLQRLALDLFHGPTTVSPIKKDARMHFPWLSFPIAFGPRWRRKWKIARHLLNATRPTSSQPLLSKDAVLVIGPGGTAFHVALQIAWRLREMIEKGKADPRFFKIIHTDSFEVARLLAPLAAFKEAPLDVYLSRSPVSRHSHTDRRKASILTNTPEPRKEERWIQSLVIGCQHIDKDGTLYTWNVGQHLSTIKGYLSDLDEDGDLFVVCTSDKIDTAGEKNQEIKIKHDPERSFIVTDEQLDFRVKNFQVISASNEDVRS